MVSIRIAISLAINFNWSLFQLDINNAFLYGELDEDVYMSLPFAYSDKNSNKVCKLLKSLYGLKQAPRKWNEKLYGFLLEFGFVQSMNDFTLFVKISNGTIVILLVYVDDIILSGNSNEEVNKVKDFLKSKFLIKDLGKLKFFLGIEVIDINKGVCLCQRKYCMELLHEFGMLSCKLFKTPLDCNVVIRGEGFDSNDVLIQNVVIYQKLIGKLIYLTITRPNISYVVQVLSQFMHSLRKSHFNIAIRLLRYLKLNPGRGFAVTKGNPILKSFVDADWAKCLVSRGSITGSIVFLGDTIISWKSKKQDTLSRSSTESEYRALGVISCEIMWILKIFFDVGLKDLTHVPIFCDNESAIKLVHNPVFNEKTKHFDVDTHFIRDRVSKGVVEVHKVSSDFNLTDIFTKPLGVVQHEWICKNLGLVDPFQNKC
ncbi:hypothetical protein Lser_V15G12411 [Lactuca serriola]